MLADSVLAKGVCVCVCVFSCLAVCVLISWVVADVFQRILCVSIVVECVV